MSADVTQPPPDPTAFYFAVVEVDRDGWLDKRWLGELPVEGAHYVLACTGTTIIPAQGDKPERIQATFALRKVTL